MIQRSQRNTGIDGLARYSRARRATSMDASCSTSDAIEPPLEPAIEPELHHPLEPVAMGREQLQERRFVPSLDSLAQLARIR